MNCPKCAAALVGGETFCGNCGEKFAAPVPIEKAQPVAQPEVKPEVQKPVTPVAPPPPGPVENAVYNSIPMVSSEYKPLSPWAYWGYTILFAIPVIGLICLIVFSFSNSNINRRNFARSYWVAFFMAIVLGIIVAVFAAIFGVSFSSLVNEAKSII